jgi:hypothetical protein
MKVITILLVVALVISGWLPFPETGQAQGPAAYRLIVFPTADPFPRQFAIGAYALVYPPALMGQMTVPVVRRFGLQASIAFGPMLLADDPTTIWNIPVLSAKFSPLPPDSSHWGLAVQAELIGPEGFLGRGARGSTIMILSQLVTSSPVSSKRVHLGIGSYRLFETRWDEEDQHLQFALFAGGEFSISRHFSLCSEAVWIAPGAYQGNYSIIAGLLEFRFKFKKVTLDLGAGGCTTRIGRDDGWTYPLPPILAIEVQL